MKIPELARRLRIGRILAWKLVKSGVIKSTVINKRGDHQIDEQALQEFLKEREGK